MEALRVRETSEEVRVEISGEFAAPSVQQLRSVWETTQPSLFWLRFVVDISGLTGYDQEGHALLHRLHRHGAIFVAGTPRSLDFLEEISSGTMKVPSFAIRRSSERSSSPRPRHRAGVGTYEASARYR